MQKPNKNLYYQLKSEQKMLAWTHSGGLTRTKLLSINNKKIVRPEHFLDFLPKIRLTIFGSFAKIGVT